MKIVIIGGVAGGASVAARARRLSEEAEIILIEQGNEISFANCGLPYFIGGDITNEQALLIQTPASFHARFNIDVRVNHQVLSIDKVKKEITVKDLTTGQHYQQVYDKLILSPGAKPIIPPIEGINNPLIFSLRNMQDMRKIMAEIQEKHPQHITVCGAGFIGLEMVEALHKRGIRVTLIDAAPQIMNQIDQEMAHFLQKELHDKQIELRLQQLIVKINAPSDNEQSSLVLTLNSGEQINTGALIMAIGVTPEIDLAQSAGLTIGALGGISVNAQMQTNDENIYAIGDAIEVINFASNEVSKIPLAGPANRQGRIVADNLFSRPSLYQKTQGTAICRLFDLTVANTGLNEKTLKAAQRPYEKVYLHAADHASYYPGAEVIHLKLLFDPKNGKILGAQAVGKKGIDKRIDIIAVAQRANLTVYDLQHLELCYSPPYGSAKDIINQAGFVASNVLNGDQKVIHFDQLAHLNHPHMIIDVRNPPELTKMGQIPGAINIPLDQLRARLTELPQDKELIVYCQVGLRGYLAYRLLTNHGYHARNLSGGFTTWKMAML